MSRGVVAVVWLYGVKTNALNALDMNTNIINLHPFVIYHIVSGFER